MGYVPSTAAERSAMLAAVGADCYDALFESVPVNLRFNGGYSRLPDNGLSEFEVLDRIGALASSNKPYKAVFRGAGAYSHLIPSCVTRLASLPEFTTAYTPYQPEISQGVLQAIFEYQTTICALTGLDASNASVYDGPSAAAEAVSMCREKGRQKAIVSSAANPATLSTIMTYCRALGIEVALCPIGEDGATNAAALKGMLDDSVACVYAESPNYYGVIEDCDSLSDTAHAAKARFSVGVNPISLAALRAPSEYGADVAVGDGQPLGMPLSFGGPYLGFMSCARGLMRKLPGRIVGQTKDSHGRRAFVLTLQAREQHIRREKASSNICSNQALCALTATVYCAAMGPAGLREVAYGCMAAADSLKGRLASLGYIPTHASETFHEFVTECPVDSGKTLAALDAAGILGGLPLPGNRILWCATEANSPEQIDELATIVKEVSRNA